LGAYLLVKGSCFRIHVAATNETEAAGAMRPRELAAMRIRPGTLAIIFAIEFLAIAVVYWLTPARQLPAYLPGHDAASGYVLYRYGFDSFLIALGLFGFGLSTREPDNE
jgi:hypothetical protein